MLGKSILHTRKCRHDLIPPGTVQLAHNFTVDSPSYSSVASTVDLISWVCASGGRCVGVEVAPQPKRGVTLLAAEDIAPGTELVRLPRHCLLTAEEAAPNVQSLSHRVPPELWPASLAFPLLAERVKGPASRFSSYIAYLPIGVQGLPLFFSPQVVQALQYPPLIQQVKLRGRWLAGFAAQHLAALPGTAEDAFGGIKVDANLLGWGMAICSSRAFKVGASGIPALLPVIDLANHSLQPNCRVKAEYDNGPVSLVTQEPIKARDPLEISYGPLSNTVLLQDYGFILPENPHDELTVSLSLQTFQAAQLSAGLLPARAIQPWQAKALSVLGVGQLGMGATVSRREPHFDWRLIAAATILNAEKEIAEVSGNDLTGLQKWAMQELQQPSSLQGLQTLRGLCGNMLAVFLTDVEEDRQLLQNAHKLPNLKSAIQYRMEMKSVLLAARSHLDGIVKGQT